MWRRRMVDRRTQPHRDFTLDADVKKRVKVEGAGTMVDSRTKDRAGARVGHPQKVLHDLGRTTNLRAHHLAVPTGRQQLVERILDRHGVCHIRRLALGRQMADRRGRPRPPLEQPFGRHAHC
jgi:hypothetical protein